MPDVTIYTDPRCQHCRQLKEYLQRKGVQFLEHDITTDQTAREQLQQMNAPGVPVIRVGDQTVIGFQQDELDRLLPTSELADARS